MQFLNTKFYFIQNDSDHDSFLSSCLPSAVAQQADTSQAEDEVNLIVIYQY